jgi:hypothetical protein
MLDKSRVDGFLQKSGATMAKITRGRPLKFGRPARAVAVTLPEDVIDALRAADPDLGRAIVSLVAERTPPTVRQPKSPVVDVAPLGRRRALIVVNPAAIPALPGCALIPIAKDRAFIALEPGRALADLELAVIDELSRPRLAIDRRRSLLTLRRALRTWRRDARVGIYERSIVVLEGAV